MTLPMANYDLCTLQVTFTEANGCEQESNQRVIYDYIVKRYRRSGQTERITTVLLGYDDFHKKSLYKSSTQPTPLFVLQCSHPIHNSTP